MKTAGQWCVWQGCAAPVAAAQAAVKAPHHGSAAPHHAPSAASPNLRQLIQLGDGGEPHDALQDAKHAQDDQRTPGEESIGSKLLGVLRKKGGAHRYGAGQPLDAAACTTPCGTNSPTAGSHTRGSPQS